MKNTSGADVNKVLVVIDDYLLLINYNQISLAGTTHGFSCRIVNGLGAGHTKATCDGQWLRPGEQITIKLRGSTTIVVGSGSANLWVTTYVNTPTSTEDNLVGYGVAWNP